MWLMIVIFVSTILYYIIQRQLSYWKRRGVPGPKPLPFVGNIGKNFMGAISMGEIIADIYRKYENYPFVGIFRGPTPCLLIRDTDFIKDITVKEFKHFQDNDMNVDKEVDPLIGRNLFFLKSGEWKSSRSQLTPCFTSGKMKNVFPLIEEVSKRLVKFVENQKEATSSTGMEAKELCAKFTIDDVAICAFGIEGKCFEDPNSDFRILAHKFISPDSWVGFKMLLLTLMPSLSKVITVKFVPNDVEGQLLDLVRTTLKYREENNIVRNDFLDFVNNISKSSTSFTDLDITAQAAGFFGDGFETSSLVMSFLLFELAMNPEAQTKLRHEINKSFENDKFTYESIQEMAYLEACLNESLRKNPPVSILSKACTERYTYTPSNPDYKNIIVTVEPGMSVILPLSGLHMDPKYFESPEKFMPERFFDKENINRYAYLPFGEGPRGCIGKRFGVLQVKVGVAYLLKNFEIKLNEKTQLPLTYDPFYPLLSPKGGLWLNFHKI